ncbi:MAG: response regulator transcription factor [Thermoanaerobaculia bacterium]|nr:response regulator transcription factor [Thermoanaerobaculia bacterium]
MAAVLLIDDDAELGRLLVEYLATDGFEAQAETDPERGVELALSGRFSILVLDVMMPRLSGIEALRRIRAASRVPVLMLTATGSDVDRIVGLELGADDYVPKPCTPRELAARLRAILRRVEGPATSGPLAIGRLTLWPERRTAEWAGRPLALTGTEFNLLEVLARHAGRVVSKSELSLQGLGRPLARFDRALDVHLSSIRHKLGPTAEDRAAIQTVRGVGYQLVRD